MTARATWQPELDRDPVDGPDPFSPAAAELALAWRVTAEDWAVARGGGRSAPEVQARRRIARALHHLEWEPGAIGRAVGRDRTTVYALLWPRGAPRGE